MIISRKTRSVLATSAAVASCAGAVCAADIKGPSSSQSPYILSTLPGVETASILTVGDAVNFKKDGVTPYRMVGIPDGIGAYDNGDKKTFTILMNHELPETAGVVREHGAKGAFVSRWTVEKKTLKVLHGEDLIKFVSTWDATTSSYKPFTNSAVLNPRIALGRLCSGDLAPLSAFLYTPQPRDFRDRFRPQTPVGYNGRFYMNGEEVGAEGRAFAHTLDGYSYELPRLGKFSYENAVANPGSGLKTVVASTDDTTPGQVYVYVGDKTNIGSPIDRAGLTNGQLYGVKVQGVALEDRTAGIASGTPFSLFNIGNVENQTGATLQSYSIAAGITEFLRPEDGQWDPNNPRDFYFVTTDRFDGTKDGTSAQIGRSRLYRLRFKDITQPELGGTVDMLLDGTEPHQMFDNMTVDPFGRVLIQEDPGNQAYLARIWEYDIKTDKLIEIAKHDPNRFLVGSPNFLTQDEESSGIIDVSDIFGPGYYILDQQAHYRVGDTNRNGVQDAGETFDAELVEGGQLLMMFDPVKKKNEKIKK